MPARLKLPVVLRSVAFAVAGAGAVAACGGDDGQEQLYYYCNEPPHPDAAVALADAGPAADAGVPDAMPCGQVVTDPAACPPGCEPEPLG